MESYSVRCKKYTKNIKQLYYQNVQNVAVKNQDLLKIKNEKATFKYFKFQNTIIRPYFALSATPLTV